MLVVSNISVKNVKMDLFFFFIHFFFFNVKILLHSFYLAWPGGAGGKGVWGAAGMVYEDEEPDARDPNYDEVAQVRKQSMIDVKKLRPQIKDMLLLRRDATKLHHGLDLWNFSGTDCADSVLLSYSVFPPHTKIENP